MRSTTFLAACAALLALLCAASLEAKSRRATAHNSPSKNAHASTKAHTAAAKKKVPQTTAKHGSRGSSKSVRASGKARRGSHGRSVASRKASSGPYRQSAPTQERYAEIQKALADRGYFTGEVNGEWRADSVDALKRFQADQNLTPDGKLNSRSLINLGLGPKRETAGDYAARPATEPPVHP